MDNPREPKLLYSQQPFRIFDFPLVTAEYHKELFRSYGRNKALDHLVDTHKIEAGRASRMKRDEMNQTHATYHRGRGRR